MFYFHEFEIDQHLIHLRVPYAFPDPESARVNAIGAGDNCRQRVCQPHTSVAVTMPVNPNLFSRRNDHLAHYETHQVNDTHGSGVSARVADHNRTRSGCNRTGVKPLYSIRIAAGSVLGDV